MMNNTTRLNSLAKTMKWQMAITCFLLLALANKSHAQPIEPVKTPDVTAFMNNSYFPVSEYSGKADVTIPIYTIKFGELEIPINITYNSGGININSAATRVGLNWTLNAGGMISKETVGYQDTYSNKYYNSETGHVVFTSFGFLSHLFDNTFKEPNGQPVGIVIQGAHADRQPDLFYVAAPGLITKFTHKDNGQPMELTNSSSIIKSPFQKPVPIDENIPVSFDVISSKGLVYTFSDVEGYVTFPEIRNNMPLPLTDGLVDEPWPINISDEEVDRISRSLETGRWRWQNASNELFPVVHLSSIVNPTSKQAVQFFYLENKLVDNYRRSEYVSGENSAISSQTNFEHDYSKEKILEKILFPEGTINFYYDGGRLDVRGGKILKKIEIKNISGEIIKGILFEQDYFITPNTDNNPQNYRLKLTGVKYYDKNNTVLPGYSFQYNPSPLPKRYSLNQDFSGYYNGNHGLNIRDYLPKIYYKANQKKNSFIPFPLSAEGYTLSSGRCDLSANLSFAKAGILERITYPTGGYCVFDYELNSFNFLGHEIEGGGLRLLSQTLYDGRLKPKALGNSYAKRLIYDYHNVQGVTSGEINNLPRFIERKSSAYFLPQTTNVRLELTNSSQVGYTNCKITEENNGYTINTYTGIKDFPNIYPETYTNDSSYPTCQAEELNKIINEGFAPTLYQNMDIKRGKLKLSEVFTNSNVLLKTTENNYSYYAYNQMDVNERNTYCYYFSSPYNDGNNQPFFEHRSKIASEGYLLTQSKVTEHVPNANDLIKENIFVYDNTRPLMKEKQLLSSAGQAVKEKYYYPFDTEVATDPYINKLLEKNILNPIKITRYRDNIPTMTTLSAYSDFGNGLIAPVLFSEAKGANALVAKIHFNKYDEKGNLLEQQLHGNIKESFIWGYNGAYMVARITNKSYNDAVTLSGINLKYIKNPMDENELRKELNKLRLIPGALVTTYTYKPLVGMVTSTDANNKTTYYEYDDFGRLSIVRDQDKNILKKVCYNFTGEPQACGSDILPMWQVNGQTRCKPCPANGAYASNTQEHEEIDVNANSQSFNATRWIDDGVRSNCVPKASWEYITPICLVDAQLSNTGYQTLTQKDMNPCSATYDNIIQTTSYNIRACPLPTVCNGSPCVGADRKCINNICTVGVLKCVRSVSKRLDHGYEWECTYQYCFGDGTSSLPFTEIHPNECTVSTPCQ